MTNRVKEMIYYKSFVFLKIGLTTLMIGEYIIINYYVFRVVVSEGRKLTFHFIKGKGQAITVTLIFCHHGLVTENWMQKI